MYGKNCEALPSSTAFTNQTRNYLISWKYRLKYTFSRTMSFIKPHKASCMLSYVYRFLFNGVGHLRLSIAPKDLILHVLLI